MPTKNIIPPGGTGAVTLRFSTKGLSGDLSRGIRIEVDVDGGAAYKVIVTSKGVVHSEGTLWASPDELTFSTFPGQIPAVKQFSVVRQGDEPLLFRRVSSNVPWIKCEAAQDMSRESNASRPILIRVGVTETPSVGVHNGEIVLETMHPRFPRISIPVRLTVESSIHASLGGVVYRSDVDAKTPVEVSLLSKTGVPFVVLAAQLEPADMGLTSIVKRSAQTQGLVKIVLVKPPSVSSDTWRGRLVMKTDDPACPEISLPILGASLQSSGARGKGQE
jgi:hypothetical protein